MEIHLSKAHVTDLEESYVLSALRSGWIAPLGPHVDAFEREVATRLGVNSALALSSGTAALHLGLLVNGVGPGTNVILPSMTFAASANAVVYTGATPVFVDSDPSGNVDTDLVFAAVDDLQRRGHAVSAILAVDLFGRPADYDVLTSECRERGLVLISDAAESLGATYQGRAAGSFGSVAALSFNGNKIITTSGGGMLLSDDEALIAHARKLATQAREPRAWYEHVEVGYNYRLSNLLAALGRAQLRRLDDILAHKRAIRRRYESRLGNTPGINFLPADDGARSSNNWLTCLRVDEDAHPRWSPSRAVEHMATRGIEVRHLWKPMHLQPVFARNRAYVNGTAAALFMSGLALPSSVAMTLEQVDQVCHELESLLHDG